MKKKEIYIQNRKKKVKNCEFYAISGNETVKKIMVVEMIVIDFEAKKI